MEIANVHALIQLSGEAFFSCALGKRLHFSLSLSIQKLVAQNTPLRRDAWWTSGGQHRDTSRERGMVEHSLPDYHGWVVVASTRSAEELVVPRVFGQRGGTYSGFEVSAPYSSQAGM